MAELPLVYVHRPSIGEAEIRAAIEVCESGWFGMGGVTLEFEERVAAVLEAPHVVGVQSGTAALHLGLLALGVGPGDEVIVPSFTFAASVQAILMAGARPVFCEVEEETLRIDVDDALARVTERTRALIPVDYGGSACDYERLMPKARSRGLRVLADSAHAFGSMIGDRPLAVAADAHCFSFDASKNITCGDGGVFVTADAELASSCRRGRNLGIDSESWSRRNDARPWAYEVVASGFRYRLGNLNAAIGLAQLERLETFRARKAEIVARYDAAFEGLAAVRPTDRDPGAFLFLYTVRVVEGGRDALIAHLAERRVQAWVHFIPNHLQPAFKEFATPLPVTERVASQVVTLPLYVGLGDDEVERVIEGVRSFAGEPTLAGEE